MSILIKGWKLVAVHKDVCVDFEGLTLTIESLLLEVFPTIHRCDGFLIDPLKIPFRTKDLCSCMKYYKCSLLNIYITQHEYIILEFPALSDRYVNSFPNEYWSNARRSAIYNAYEFFLEYQNDESIKVRNHYLGTLRCN